MTKECPYIRIGNTSDTERVKELLKKLDYGYPMNTQGYLEIANLFYTLNQHVTLLTPDCDVIDIEGTLENFRHIIDRAK